MRAPTVAAPQESAGLPVIVVAGMAFEAQIARGEGVEAVYAARADLLERALRDAVQRGCAGILSFGTAGGLAPELTPGTIVVADAVDGPLGRVMTDTAWTQRLAAALAGSPLAARLRRGIQAAVSAPLTTAADKQALYRSTGALAVDMESHIAGAIAAAHGVPFAVCRAVVDPAWRSLPPAAMAGLRDDGSTAVLPVLRELARRPAQLGSLLQVAADARAARVSLVRARQVLERARALRPVSVGSVR